VIGTAIAAAYPALRQVRVSPGPLPRATVRPDGAMAAFAIGLLAMGIVAGIGGGSILSLVMTATANLLGVTGQ
jgi:hypothetical protein